jgi:hypothetical protein
MSSEPINQTNNRLEFLFGKPVLLEGEDEDLYQRLRAAVIDELKPNSTFEWINTEDQIDKLWEERRYKRAAAALINGGIIAALMHYLHEVCSVDDAEDLSDKYLRGGAKGQKEVLALLAQRGITIEQLQAKAAQLEGNGLAMFDRLVTSRESGRRILRKEAERYSQNPGKGSGETTKG